jgi:hypothetical protein
MVFLKTTPLPKKAITPDVREDTLYTHEFIGGGFDDSMTHISSAKLTSQLSSKLNQNLHLNYVILCKESVA